MALFNAGRRGDQYAQYANMLGGQVRDNQFALLDDARNSANDYYGAGRDALGRGYTDATRSLEAGNGQAGTIASWMPGVWQGLGGYDSSAKGYDWSGRATQSRGDYRDALGLNGAEASGKVLANFQAGPGYQYQVNQATDALARKASALGMAGSGNTMAAISDRAGQMANGEFGNWLTRLGGLDQMDSGIAASMSQGDANRAATLRGQAAAGLSGAYGTMAGLAGQYGRDQANLATTYGQNMNASYGTNAGLDMGVAGAKNNIWNTFLTNGLQGAQASAQGNNADDAGRLGLGMGIANLGMQFLGGGGMGSLGNFFKGGSSGVGAGTSAFW